MRTVSRDPFARYDFVRKQLTGFSAVLPDSDGSFASRLHACDWCGTVRRTRKGYPFSYRYGVQPDSLSGHIHWDAGTFCSLSCRQSHIG